MRATLTGSPDRAPATLLATLGGAHLGGAGDGGMIADDDAQLALWMLYELHYRGLEGVSDRWEWQPGLMVLTRRLEQAFEGELRERLGDLPGRFADAVAAGCDLPAAFDLVVGALPGRSVSRYVQGAMTLPQWREFLVAKSVYQLKEADPHSWAIPRCSGDVKSALIDIQYDEYGDGRPGRQHAQLFEHTLLASGLDARYGRYVDVVPASVLALNNLMTMFGLHRRLQGALLGQLAHYEATSCLPNKHYAAGGRRLGIPEPALTYFTEHVEVDAVHEQIAVHDLVGGHLAQHPDHRAEVGFGIAAGVLLDNALADAQLTAWRDGRSFLREEHARGG